VKDVHVVVSHPGPVEAGILEELSGSVSARRRQVSVVSLRTLEGGEGEPTLFLHGRGHAATIWAPILAEVARSRRVVAVDLPGFGHASSPPFRSRDPEEALSFFVDPLAALVRSLELGDASIVAHGLGGLVAIELVLRGHVRPPKLVLVSSLGLGPRMRLPARVAFHAGLGFAQRALGASLRSRDGDPWSSRLARLEAELASLRGGMAPPTHAASTLAPLRGPVYDRSFDLKRIDAETLLVWGEEDPVIPVPVAMAAAASMPRAELVVLPKLGHAPHVEGAARVTPLVASFLS